jgi:hypothetical protein
MAGSAGHPARWVGNAQYRRLLRNPFVFRSLLFVHQRLYFHRTCRMRLDHDDTTVFRQIDWIDAAPTYVNRCTKEAFCSQVQSDLVQRADFASEALTGVTMSKTALSRC